MGNMGGGKGGSASNSTTQRYAPSETERYLGNMLVGNAESANKGIGNMLGVMSGGDYQGIADNASNIIASGQNTYNSLLQGELPSAYRNNITDTVGSITNKTVGSAVNALTNRGVIGSSMGEKAFKNASDSAADAINRNMLGYSAQLGNIAGNAIGNANAGFSPYQTVANMGANAQNAFITAPLNSMKWGVASGSGNQSQNVGLGQAMQIAALLAM